MFTSCASKAQHRLQCPTELFFEFQSEQKDLQPKDGCKLAGDQESEQVPLGLRCRRPAAFGL